LLGPMVVQRSVRPLPFDWHFTCTHQHLVPSLQFLPSFVWLYSESQYGHPRVGRGCQGWGQGCPLNKAPAMQESKDRGPDSASKAAHTLQFPPQDCSTHPHPESKTSPSAWSLAALTSQVPEHKGQIACNELQAGGE
jgi:hypothetical protein